MRLAALAATFGTGFTSVGASSVNPDPKVGVPSSPFHASKRQTRHFPHQLFALARCVSMTSEGSLISLTGASRSIADDVSLLLLRFGNSREIDSAATGLALAVSDEDSQRRSLGRTPGVLRGQGLYPHFVTTAAYFEVGPVASPLPRREGRRPRRSQDTPKVATM